MPSFGGMPVEMSSVGGTPSGLSGGGREKDNGGYYFFLKYVAHYVKPHRTDDVGQDDKGILEEEDEQIDSQYKEPLKQWVQHKISHGATASEIHLHTFERDWEYFDSIRFRGCSFKLLQAPKTEQQGHSFQKCDLQGVDFSQSILNGSRFEEANLARCIFTNADLEGVSMGGAVLERCDFRSAKNLDPKRPWTVGESRTSRKPATFLTYKLPKRA